MKCQAVAKPAYPWDMKCQAVAKPAYPWDMKCQAVAKPAYPWDMKCQAVAKPAYPWDMKCQAVAKPAYPWDMKCQAVAKPAYPWDMKCQAVAKPAYPWDMKYQAVAKPAYPWDRCSVWLQQRQSVMAEEANLYQAFHCVTKTLHSSLMHAAIVNKQNMCRRKHTLTHCKQQGYLHFCHTCQPVYDVTDKSHWYTHRLLGTRWQHIWSCFRNFQTLVFSKHDQKLSEKPLHTLVIPFLLCLF